MDLVAFYQAFSPACFALLALWIVVVQLRIDEWQKDPVRQRRAYGVALHFVLPGMMGVLALGVAAYAAAIVLYVLIGVLAIFGGAAVLRAEAVLQTILVFLGFNVAWLLLFDGRSPAPVTPSGTMG